MQVMDSPLDVAPASGELCTVRPLTKPRTCAWGGTFFMCMGRLLCTWRVWRALHSLALDNPRTCAWGGYSMHGAIAVLMGKFRHIGLLVTAWSLHIFVFGNANEAL